MAVLLRFVVTRLLQDDNRLFLASRMDMCKTFLEMTMLDHTSAALTASSNGVCLFLDVSAQEADASVLAINSWRLP